MNELQPTIEWLTNRWPGLTTLFLVAGAARFVFKFFSEWLRGALTNALINAAADDPQWARDLVVSRNYRVTAFLIDLLVSVKLPRAKDLEQRSP